MSAIALGSEGLVLDVGGVSIKQDRNGRFCLNDLHRASGGEKRHGPSYWMANQQTRELIAEIETTGIPAVAAYEGANGGTYVVKELVYAYAMWVSPAFHLKVIRAYDQRHSPRPAELSRMDILKLAMESEEARIKAEAERDEAIRTKHLIGSKREATAMATAAAKSKEVNRLKHELGRNQLHATVKAVKKMTGIEYDWRAMRKHCKEHGIDARNVVDEQYGSVKAWPAMAWREVHGVDLETLFQTDKEMVE